MQRSSHWQLQNGQALSVTFLLIFAFILRSLSLVCAISVDLGFLIDGSSSIERYGRGNFGRLLNLVKSLVSFFPISRRDTHVGVVLYTHRAIPIFNFNRYYNRALILRAIDNMRYPRGSTYIGKALTFARRYLYPGRPASGRKRVLIVLTDGVSKDSVSTPARRLRASGCEIFVLGIGRGHRKSQLRQIATDRNHVFEVSFRSLGSVIQTIKTKACQKLPPTPSKNPIYFIIVLPVSYVR